MWNGDALDLEAYLAHLGHDGDRSPSLATLRALHRAHVLSVRWENVEAVLRKYRPLDVESVQAKLIGSARGGTCFEHVTLYAAALERLGFRFVVVQGRVQMGETRIRPATHAMVIVELAGKRWLSDIGFGASPLEPIELTDATDVPDGVWPYRLRRQEVGPGVDGWALYQPAGPGQADNSGDGWMIRHTFTLHPQYPVDLRVTNHFGASSRHSAFSDRIFVQRLHPDRLHLLDNRRLTTVTPERPGPPETRDLEPHEVPEVLAGLFGVELSAADAELLVPKLV
ncbi:arylamine N-acetyltransferase family protein [Streptomyces flavofungini]|uniref:Arylamine N-acetyltransferase n=1 Tax=Streptomyces flavofungini TaxID=68200 RepID=A0ABS0X0C2_9ACTN|nr:arylamine N-acetyltransferase [Streptomyces flavofungini]MBJ3806619.1 arylamine N-acetyltransferase [Streptomyces flavofungini]GHC61697.1 putative arylamine n-acetyl transferase [Streptomyces flavofungini]